MSAFRRTNGVLAVIILLAMPAWADAHRLDEYLQATRLAIESHRVGVEIDLTAGSELAVEAFGWIDTDGDGQISPREAGDYARLVLRDASLSVDGRPASVVLTDFTYPSREEMTQGLGTFRIRAGATVAASSAGRHRVEYVNAHRPERSVYLVNALMPDDPRIRIGSQQRDRAQHGLTLDYDVAASASDRVWTLLGGIALLGGFLIARRQPLSAFIGSH